MLYISKLLANHKYAKSMMALGCSMLLLGGSIAQPVVASETELTQVESVVEVVEPINTIDAVPEIDTRLPYEELRRFASVFAAIKNRYVEPVDNAKLVDAAINGMLEDLDPHSTYLNEEAFANLQEATEGSFGGLGIEINETSNKEIEIISPIEDSPAARAGILPGDVIVKIDGESIKSTTLNEVVKKLRGKPGTSIELSVRRGEEVLDLTIERDMIKVQSVRSKMLENDIAYVRVSQFQERTVEELVKNLRAFKNKPKALVLDLRNDPGGLLNAAVGVAGAFIEPEKLVVYTKSRGEVNLRYRVVPSDYSLNHRDPLKGLPSWSREIPMVVLINIGSASASEIVAGALQDYERATIMGNRSFGKGSVQVVLALGDDTGVKLTVARYYTPKDRSIQARGIEPDIVVTDTADGDFFNIRREADLSDHLSSESASEVTENLIDDAESADKANQVDESDKDNETKQSESVDASASTAVADSEADVVEDGIIIIAEAEKIESETAEDGSSFEMYTFGSDEDYQLQQAVKYLIGEHLEPNE